MGEIVTFLFWSGLVVTVALSFVMDFTADRWVPVSVLLALGGFASVGNWAIVYFNLRKGTTSSFVPFLGGLLLCLGFWRAPSRTLPCLAPLALLVDPSILIWIPYGVSRMLAWSGRKDSDKGES